MYMYRTRARGKKSDFKKDGYVYSRSTLVDTRMEREKGSVFVAII